MRSVDLIVIHCSASPNGQSLFRGQPGTPSQVTPVQAIDRWHRDRGFRRDPAACAAFNPELTSIGYHLVIYTNGTVAAGRALGEVGAHAKGHNASSVGICLVGTDRFTAAQWGALAGLVRSLQKGIPDARICGHRDLPDVHKTCPGFDVAAWLAGGMAPLPDHLLEI